MFYHAFTVQNFILFMIKEKVEILPWKKFWMFININLYIIKVVHMILESAHRDKYLQNMEILIL